MTTETKTKHTSGPWHLGANGDRCARNHAICADNRVIAKVYGLGYPIGEGWSEKSQADAQLMVAAPELLEALEWYVEQEKLVEQDAHHTIDLRILSTKARSAIQKTRCQKELAL